MLKNLAILEHLIGEKIFQFVFDPNATLGEMHDALYAMKDFIVQRIKEGHEKKDAVDPQPAPAPEQEGVNAEEEKKD